MIQRTASAKSARAVVGRQLAGSPTWIVRQPSGFSSGDIAGGIADQKRPLRRNFEIAERAFDHPTLRFAAGALLGRVMRAVIDFRDADAVRARERGRAAD